MFNVAIIKDDLKENLFMISELQNREDSLDYVKVLYVLQTYFTRI